MHLYVASDIISRGPLPVEQPDEPQNVVDRVCSNAEKGFRLVSGLHSENSRAVPSGYSTLQKGGRVLALAAFEKDRSSSDDARGRIRISSNPVRLLFSDLNE